MPQTDRAETAGRTSALHVMAAHATNLANMMVAESYDPSDVQKHLTQKAHEDLCAALRPIMDWLDTAATGHGATGWGQFAITTVEAAVMASCLRDVRSDVDRHSAAALLPIIERLEQVSEGPIRFAILPSLADSMAGHLWSICGDVEHNRKAVAVLRPIAERLDRAQQASC